MLPAETPMVAYWMYLEITSVVSALTLALFIGVLAWMHIREKRSPP
jgi:hypothetical protein